MTKAPISLQDLRRRLYVKVKAEGSGRQNVSTSAGSGGAGNGCTTRLDSFRSTAFPIGSCSRQSLQSDRSISFAVKCAGARSAGNPHATCDAAGVGNGAMAIPKRARRGKPRTQAKEEPTGGRASARPYQCKIRR